MQKLLSRISLAALLLSMPPAFAEKADSFQAMTIDADRVTVDELKRTSVFTGHVVISQGSLLVKAERVVYQQSEDGDNYVITASGSPINFRQKQDNSPDFIEAYAEQLEFNSKTQQARLLRRATLRRGKDEVRGDTIFYDMRTQQYEVKGAPRASGSPGSDRIKVIIQPRRQQPPSDGVVPAPASSGGTP